jgi:hypothetical protein
MKQGLCQIIIFVPHEVKITFGWNLISKQFFQWQIIIFWVFPSVKFEINFEQIIRFLE